MKSELYQLSEEEINDFDQLYDGTLTEEAYYLIKAKLQLDEVLQHKYLVYKMLRNQIEQDGLSNKVLKTRLAKLNEKSHQRKRRMLFGVGFISSLLVIILILLQLNRDDAHGALYDKYKNSESGLSIPMSDANPSPLASAMIAIANNQYELGIDELAKCSPTDTTLYYWAYCQERLAADDTALKTYKKLTTSQSITIKQKSQFRIALLHLKHNDKNAPTELLNIAKDATNTYNKLAQELLVSMSKK